jgi:hypothetical protein
MTVVTGGCQGLAQPSDVNIHGPFFHKDMVTPDVVQQLAAAVNTLWVGHEEVQQPELGWAQFQGLTTTRDPVSLRV